MRVVASDGVLSAHADSAPFQVALKPPEPRIVSPEDGARIQWGQLLSFIGEADDLQDGGVPARRLFWTRRRGAESAPLGSGPLLSVADLPVGTHEVTFTAVNRSGLSASASVTVTVHDDLELPGPTLAAGPLQVGWQVASPAARAVTAQVHIANAGEGSLKWTAAEAAPWLALDRTSGAAPATLVLTADPAGLRSDRVYTAELVLAAPAAGGEPAQAVTIAVSLVVGDPRAAPPEPELVRGDSNGDGGVDLSDAIFVLNGLFLGGRLPACRSAADANGDRALDISDASYLLNFLFLGGRPPPAPFPGCGPAVPEDDLGCLELPAGCR